MNLLLIDNRINDMEVVLDSLLPNIDYIIVDFQNDTLDSIQSNINNKNQTYEYIGIFQENYETSSYQFVESFGSSILTDVSTDDPDLNTWASYIQMITYFKDVLKMQTLDLMGCNIRNDSNWSYVIQYIQNHVGDIVINSSSDNTGSADMGGNWILESSNENLIGIYFTENIKNYKFVLGVLNNSANPGVLPYIHYKLDRYNEVSQIGLTSGANGVMSQTGVANASYNGGVSCLDLSNNPVYERDGSCYFDGGSKYVNLPSVTLNSTSGYTFSLWVKFPDSTPSVPYTNFLFLNNLAVYSDTIRLHSMNSGQPPFNFIANIGGISFPIYYNCFYRNIWYNVVLSISYSEQGSNNSIYKFYINGTLLQTTSGAYPTLTTRTNNNIGANLTGYMYDVRIYNSVLSNTQIYNLYKNPLDFYPIICYPLNNATDGLVNRGSLYATTSGLPFNCDLSGSTIANLPTFVADSPDRQLSTNTSMLLNSTYSQFVSFPAVSSGGGGFATLNNGLTFSTWFNLTANAGQWSRIFDCGNGTSNNNILLFISSTNSLTFTIANTNGYRDMHITNANNLSLNTWYHIAATITYSTTNTSIYNFYLNGVFIYTTTFYYPTTTTRTRNYLGKSNWTGDLYANIKLYDFRIYQNVLSEGQVQKMYNEILTTDWLQLTSASNKYTSCYVKGSLDISGDFIMRNGRLYLPNTSVSAAYLSTNVQCQPFNNVLTGLSTCAGGLRVTKGCSATALYVANSNINYNNISGILQVSSANTTSISVTTSYLNSTSNGYTDGLVFTIYSGYMDENTDNFVTYLSRFRLPNTGIVNGIPSISEGTDYIIPENDSFDYYSVMWVGYFKPDVTGVWTFYTTSDDGSYLWIGSSAETGYTRANAVVNNGGLHGPQERSGTISLVAGTYYYIRIIQGEAGSGDTMIVSFSKPGSTTKITNGIGYFYNSESMRYLAFTLLGSPNINATNSTIRSLNTSAMTTTNLYATTGYFKGGVVVKLLEIKMPFWNTGSTQITNIAVGTDILTTILTGYQIYNVVAIGYKVAFTTDNCTYNNYYGSMIGVGNNGAYNSSSVYIGTLVTNILNIVENTGFGYKFQANSVWNARSTSFGSKILENISTIYNGQGGENTQITAFGNSCGQNNKSTGGYNSYFGSNSDSSMNTTQNFNNSTTIGAFSQFFDSNQIVFGVSNTRLYVPGSYIGIKKYVPSNPYALDISGNLALSGSLTTSNGTTNITLNINTISSCYLYSTTNNTINSVDLYSTGSSTLGNTGLGYKTFNSITTGYSNSVFGFCPNVVSSGNSYSFFGYNTSALFPTQGAKTAFGINIRHLNSNVAFFGANIHGNANSAGGLSNCLFGVYSFYNKNGNGGSNSCFGYKTCYNSINPANVTYAGYQAGQNDLYGTNNTCIGSDSGQLSSNTLTLQQSSAIGAGAVLDVSNQIVFGTTSERLYVPGSYLGIGQFTPGAGRVLDISGNAQFPNYLTTGTLITTFSTSAALNTTYNESNRVRMYCDIATNVGIGYQAFNTLTIGGGAKSNSLFGYYPHTLTTGFDNCLYGYKLDLSTTDYGRCIFGVNIVRGGEISTLFGGYINCGNNYDGKLNTIFGAYSFYNQAYGYGQCVAFGYQSSYNSLNPYQNVSFGYKAGYNDAYTGGSISIGSNSGGFGVFGMSIGANAHHAANQIVFGTTSERLYVPGSYLGIGQFSPGLGRVLDIRGNAQFPNYLTTGTLITTFSTSAALNTTYNESNSVRMYSNNTSTCTGIGILMFNKLTTGDTNVLFGNNRSNDIIITTRFSSIFGFNLTNTSNPSSGGTSLTIFGAFTGIGSSNQTTFGAYSNSNANSITSATFGAFCQYKKTSTSIGSQSLIGYGAGYNSNTSSFNTHAGYQSGQYDIDGSLNCYIGANTGQLSNSTLNLQGSTAIGISAKLDVSNQIVFGTTSERTYVPGSYLGIRKFTPGQGYSVDVSGNMRISQGNLRVSGTGTAQSWPTWSDYRIKENITPLLAEKYTINNLNPVHYTNHLSNKQDIGFIAHEVQCIYPELVYGEKDGSDYQSINYNGFIPILTKEIQDIKEKMHKKEENAKIIRKHEIARSVSTKCFDCMCIETIDLLPGTWAICYQVCIDVKHALHTKNIRIGLSINNNKQLHNICNYEIIGNFLYSNMEIESFEQNTTIDLIVEYEGNKDSIDFINSKSYLIYKKLSNGAVQ